MAKRHRGEILQDVVLKSGVKVSRLYGALGISRATLYRRFEDPNLDFDFIRRVGEIIYHNFAEEFKELAPVPSVAETIFAYQLDDLEGCKNRLLRVYELYMEKVQQYDELKVRYDALVSARSS